MAQEDTGCFKGYVEGVKHVSWRTEKCVQGIKHLFVRFHAANLCACWSCVDVRMLSGICQPQCSVCCNMNCIRWQTLVYNHDMPSTCSIAHALLRKCRCINVLGICMVQTKYRCQHNVIGKDSLTGKNTNCPAKLMLTLKRTQLAKGGK